MACLTLAGHHDAKGVVVAALDAAGVTGDAAAVKLYVMYKCFYLTGLVFRQTVLINHFQKRQQGYGVGCVPSALSRWCRPGVSGGLAPSGEAD